MPESLRNELAAHLPRGAKRKFSENGLQISHILQELDAQTEEPIVSVSTFAESRSLEEFIDSFPTPSPARFQRSVHPSAVQQARVTFDNSIRTYIPIAGKDGITIVAVRTALTQNHPILNLVGGEECGTWSVDIKAGSRIGFAFGLKIESKPSADKAPIATIRWTDAYDPTASEDTSLLTFYRALRDQSDYIATHPDMGTISIEWK